MGPVPAEGPERVDVSSTSYRILRVEFGLIDGSMRWAGDLKQNITFTAERHGRPTHDTVG